MHTRNWTRHFGSLGCWLTMAGGLPTTIAAQQWNFLDGPAYSGRMATFDWARGRLVWFGQDGATWELARGELLSRPVSGTSPPPRIRGLMVFDLNHRHTLLFGGIDGTNTALGDTWIWDGATWTQLTAGPQPPARGDAAGAFRFVQSRIVMYGGQVPFVGQLSDTWEHDGTQWIARSPATVPGPNSPVMAYDLIRDRIVMVTHSGFTNTPVLTYEWDGIDWTQRATTGPTSNGNEGMAYDLPRGRTVLFGGVGTQNEIWEWDGSAWFRIVVPNAPPRLNPAVQFDPVLGHISIIGGWSFLISGFTVLQGSARTDAWHWNGTNLTLTHGELRPPSRYGHTFVADDARGELVLFGGVLQQAASDDTWTWDGNSWTEQNPTTRPSARASASGVTNVVQGSAMLFGGNSAGTLLNDLWAWNGSDWTLVNNGTGPSPRSSAGMAFDLLRGVIVLFGGTTGSPLQASNMRNDTWEWNGTTWTQRTTALAPSVREAPAMAFDPLLGKVFLFGGRNGATAAHQMSDFWQWDGAQWTPLLVQPAPPALLSPSLNLDANGQRLLLTGSASSQSTEVWQYYQGVWTRLAIDNNPQLGGAVLMDPIRQRLVSSKGALLAEWTTTPAAVTDIGTPCGPLAARLFVRTRPRLGAAAFGLETRNFPQHFTVFAISDAAGNTPIGGCTLWLGGTIATVVTPSNQFGEAEILVPIPADPGLRNVLLYAQAAALAPGPGCGCALTQGLRLRLGD